MFVPQSAISVKKTPENWAIASGISGGFHMVITIFNLIIRFNSDITPHSCFIITNLLKAQITRAIHKHE